MCEKTSVGSLCFRNCAGLQNFTKKDYYGKNLAGIFQTFSQPHSVKLLLTILTKITSMICEKFTKNLSQLKN